MSPQGVWPAPHTTPAIAAVNDLPLLLPSLVEAEAEVDDRLRPTNSCNMICCMRRDSRLSGVLHVLLNMADFEGAVTSERLATVMGTNPVVVRRLMGGLRDLGLVASEKGHGGGWTLACHLDRVTLRDVYVAFGSPGLIAMRHSSAEPTCLVEQAVNDALGTAFVDAERLLLERFSDVTLGHLSADFHRRKAKRGLCGQEKQSDVA